MNNNDFDMLLRSVHYSAKLQIEQFFSNSQKKIKCYLYNTSWVYKLNLSKNLQLCLSTSSLDFTSPDEQISNRVDVIACVEYYYVNKHNKYLITF